MPASRAYYWIGLRRRKATPPPDSDLGAVYADKIAVTPLHMNLTDRRKCWRKCGKSWVKHRARLKSERSMRLRLKPSSYFCRT